MRRGETPPPEGLTDHIASGFGESEFLRSTQKSEIHPTEEQQIRIRRRTALLLERRKAMSNLEHLKYDDWERLSVLKNGAKLRGISNEHEADVIESRLHENMPWMAEATEVFWLAMRRSVREGALGLKIPPILLDGPAGIGKSYWARQLGELLSLPTTEIEATGENASFSIVGSQRGWSGTQPGRVIGTILQNCVANPVILIDELEKAGVVTSERGHAFGLTEALLPFLEPLSARHWSCPYYQVKFDMSWMIWVLTVNDSRLLSAPFLSRCPPIRLRNLTNEELVSFIQREGKRQNISEIAVDAVVCAISRTHIHRAQPNLRVASRLLRRAADLESAVTFH